MLTDRQIKIIKAIVEEYTNTGEAVGSQTLDQKYRLGVSPATIRNEMSDLSQQGFLAKPHSSSGRIPTSTAIKFYVSELLKERDLSVAEEVAIKERVWHVRADVNALLEAATRVLSERTKSLSVATTDAGRTYHAGYPNLLNNREFYDIDLFREILLLLDEHQRIAALFSRAAGSDSIHLLLGDEFGYDSMEPVSCLFADIQIGDHRGSLGIIAPNRQLYEQNIPLVRYVASLVNQIAQS
jgi:heat-inducible transcriptional repressor